MFKSHLISFMLSISFLELTSIKLQMLNWKLKYCCDFNLRHVVNLYLWNIWTQEQKFKEKKMYCNSSLILIFLVYLKWTWFKPAYSVLKIVTKLDWFNFNANFQKYDLMILIQNTETTSVWSKYLDFKKGFFIKMLLLEKLGIWWGKLNVYQLGKMAASSECFMCLPLLFGLVVHQPCDLCLYCK